MEKKLKKTSKWKDIQYHEKTNYFLNVHTNQSNLQIQCNPQSYNSNFHRNRTNNPKVCKDSGKILNSQSNLEKEEQNWRHHAS